MSEATEALDIRGLTAAYGRRAVLNGLSAAPIRPGSLVAVLGPNASGKSTLMRSLARLHPARGEVRAGGLDLLHCPRDRHVRHVAYLPQTPPQASSLLVYEALLGALKAACPGLSAAQIEQRLQAVFAALQIGPLAMRPMGQLSGGQRQMVGLAQVLARQARLLLLDEPTSALDLRWQLLALQTVRAAVDTHGAIALVAIHDLNLALRFCDRVLVLGGGHIVADGAPADVIDAALLRRTYAVEGRVMTVADGDTVVLVDRAAEAPADPR